MTKSLTEQWKDGELEEGYYYVKVHDMENIVIDEYCLWYGVKGKAKKEFSFGMSIEEVLAPVPIYEDFLIHRDYCKDHQKLLIENMNLKKQLEIATKALKEYSVSDNWFMEDSEGKCWSFNKQYPWRIGFKALKEMEGVNENDEKR